jgi:SNF2 family DNA or RNA helicase
MQLEVEERSDVHARASTKEQRVRYNCLVREARQAEKQGDAVSALTLYRQSVALHHTAPLAAKVLRLRARQRALDALHSTEHEPWLHCELDDRYYLPSMTGDRHENTRRRSLSIPRARWEQLFPYQRGGLAWLWRMYCTSAGGILGDDMGLGKTVQISAFLEALYREALVRRILLVLPVAVVEQWKKELAKWAPDLPLVIFHGSNRRQRESALQRAQTSSAGGVCLTTYGMVVTSSVKLSGVSLRADDMQVAVHQDERGVFEFAWDAVILDEVDARPSL